jgi:hypothetical protein
MSLHGLLKVTEELESLGLNTSMLQVLVSSSREADETQAHVEYEFARKNFCSSIINSSQSPIDSWNQKSFLESATMSMVYRRTINSFWKN